MVESPVRGNNSTDGVRGEADIARLAQDAFPVYITPLATPPALRLIAADAAVTSLQCCGQPTLLAVPPSFRTAQTSPASAGIPDAKIEAQNLDDKFLIFARAGFNTGDGWWFDNEYRHRAGSGEAVIYAKTATLTGFIPRITLTNRQADSASTLTMGRNQDDDTTVYDQAELVLETSNRPAGFVPLSVSYSLSGGWFREPAVSAETSRLQYVVGFTMPSVPLTAKTSWEASGSWQDAVYGTRARQSVLQLNGTLATVMDAHSTTKLSYSRQGVVGASPFTFDTIDPLDIYNVMSLEVFYTAVRADEVTTTVHDGVSYDFIFMSPSLVVGYKEEAVGRLTWGLDAEYDLVFKDLKLSTDSTIPLGSGTNFGVQAIYHPSSGLFEKADYLLTSRIYGCVDLQVKYRQTKREFFFQIDTRPCDP